jgi:hypothetical protein
MKSSITLLLALAALSVAPVTHSQGGCVQDRYGAVQCGPAGSHCLQDMSGEVKCSPPDGGILLDRYRTPVCGPGRCLTTRHGDVVCSSAPKGSAAVNINGDAVCTDGCVQASANACTIPVR